MPARSMLLDLIREWPTVNAFRRIGELGDDPIYDRYEPVLGDCLSRDGEDEFYIVRGTQVLPNCTQRHCLMDLSLPERINDTTLFVDGCDVKRVPTYRCEGSVVPDIAIDGAGNHELFYSKPVPEVGLAVLRHGLRAAKRKCYIAADLGYILRDERRYREAVEMFRLALTGHCAADWIQREIDWCSRRLAEDGGRVR